MSEFDSVGTVLPGDRSGDRPRKHPNPPKGEEEFPDEDEELDDDDIEGLPEEVLRKRREGRSVAPKGKDEQGQIIDILA
jgi:hypothetical protein